MPSNIIDFSDMPFSTRHGSYAGMAGDKDGIVYQNEPWIIKYPKTGRFLQNQQVSYMTSPLSEYIGSHIFQQLGIPVHETLLGIRNGKVVVACKDFRPKGQLLLEMKMIKNAANAELSDRLEQELHYSSTGDRVNLNEMLLHLQYNNILRKTPGVTERFWETAVVDILIDNSDRNNGNWGILQNEDTQEVTLAPVYDNGNSFSNKASDEQLQCYMEEPEQALINRLIGGRTAYEYDGSLLSSKKLLQLQNSDLQKAILAMVPRIQKNISQIECIIREIPEEYQGHSICSDIRKDYYIRGIKKRYEKLLEPVFLYLYKYQLNIKQKDKKTELRFPKL